MRRFIDQAAEVVVLVLGAALSTALTLALFACVTIALFFIFTLASWSA